MRGPLGRAGRRNMGGTIGAAVVAALAACGGDDAEKSPGKLVAEGSRLSRLDVSVTESRPGRPRYAAPDTVRGGLVEIRFRNAGRSPRKAQLWRVEGGHTVGEALRVGRRLPPWLTWAGGVGLTQPGRIGVAVQRLPRGRYYLTGLRDQRRGVAPLGVTAAGTSGRAAKAAGRITALDYGYKVSGLEAGAATVEFLNAGGEPHHAFFAPLQEGRTIAEARAFFAGKLQGPPPVDPEGTRESVVLEGGQRQVTRLNLESGRYALLCVVRDRDGGPPHTEKGMITEVKVP